METNLTGTHEDAGTCGSCVIIHLSHFLKMLPRSSQGANFWKLFEMLVKKVVTSNEKTEGLVSKGALSLDLKRRPPKYSSKCLGPRSQGVDHLQKGR